MLLKPKGSVISILDVGSTKVLCVIAKMKPDGAFTLIGVGHKCLSGGIERGCVTDARAVIKCLLAAIDEAERVAGERINNVYVVMSGFGTESHYYDTEIFVNGHEINDKDIKILRNKCRDFFKDNTQNAIIQIIPLEYTLDNNAGICDPRGLYGNVLSVSFHVIMTPKSALVNLAHCISKCHVEIAGYISSAQAVGVSSLSRDERRLGVTAIDIGGGCTTVGVFKEDRLIYTSVTPVGGMHITKDIASGLSTTIVHAERIKILHGSVLVTNIDRNEPVEIQCITNNISGPPLANKTSHVTKEALSKIIRPRVEEILELVTNKLLEDNLNHVCTQRVVITGGTSKLMGIKEMIPHISKHFVKNVRNGYAIFDDKSDLIDTKDPGFSSTIGALLLIRDEFFSKSIRIPSNTRKNGFASLRNIIHWFKEKVES